jgi:hypothetical protein
MGFSSSCIYFPNIIKAVAKSPCRGAAFEPSPAFQSRESSYVVVSVAAATVDTGAGINRRCGDWERICVSRPGFEKPG